MGRSDPYELRYLIGTVDKLLIEGAPPSLETRLRLRDLVARLDHLLPR